MRTTEEQASKEPASLRRALGVAWPVMLGYVAIGIPCGIMEDQIGYSALMAFVMSVTFYSGAGQFMIPNMVLSGAPIASVVASVSFVNTRQILYSAAFAPYFQKVRRRLAFLFSATVTDESFGVNMARYQEGGWCAENATMVNLLCMFTWGAANAVGVLAGQAASIPTAIASFAMTSIFICLLASQKPTKTNVAVGVCAILGVCACKAVGLTGPAILIGACVGVAAGMLYRKAGGAA